MASRSSLPSAKALTRKRSSPSCTISILTGVFGIGTERNRRDPVPAGPARHGRARPGHPRLAALTTREATATIVTSRPERGPEARAALHPNLEPQLLRERRKRRQFFDVAGIVLDDQRGVLAG